MRLTSLFTPLIAALTLAASSRANAAALTPRTDINPAVLYWQGFSVFPDYPDDIKGALLSNPPTLPSADAEAALKRLDGTFRFLRRAAQMKPRCDWGIDLSDGPEALIPNLIKIRQCVNAAEARAHYALEAGHDHDAIDDLAAILVLGRNSGTDGTLVSTMVGLSVENRVNDFVARHFYRFGPRALQSLVRQIESAPPRPTVKQAMALERAALWEWFIARIEGIRLQHPNDDSAALRRARELLVSTLGADAAEIDRIVVAAGSSTSGLVAYFRDLGPIYDSLERIANAAPDKVEQEASYVRGLIDNHTNLIAKIIFPEFGRARKNELSLITRSAMLRAGIALRLEGEAGLARIRDPFADGPFEMKRLPADSGEVGFELSSKLASRFESAPMKFLEDAPAPLKRKVDFE